MSVKIENIIDRICLRLWVGHSVARANFFLIVYLHLKTPTMDTLAVTLSDGTLDVPYSNLDVLSVSSFSLCHGDVESAQHNTYTCDKLTRKELQQILSCLEGKCLIQTLNQVQIHFMETNLLLPPCIADMKAYQERCDHTNLLTGNSNIFMRDYTSDITNTLMHSELDHIVPVQIACDEHGVRMICICEGVPIFTSYTGVLPIKSDNLYEMRIQIYMWACKLTTLIHPGCRGQCINSKCKRHEKDGHDVNYWPEDLYDIARCTDYENCAGVGASIIAGSKNNNELSSGILSLNGCVYMSNSTKNVHYCPDHFPYFKHTATQEKADAVMEIMRTKCFTSYKPKGFMSGYVNLKEC